MSSSPSQKAIVSLECLVHYIFAHSKANQWILDDDIDKSFSIENLDDKSKINKLLYYLQGHFLCQFGLILFDNDLTACEHGVMVEDYKTIAEPYLYSKTKSKTPSGMDPSKIKFLNHVLMCSSVENAVPNIKHECFVGSIIPLL